MGRRGRTNSTIDRTGRHLDNIDHSRQQARSRRANVRRKASEQTGVPMELLPMWLGGNPGVGDDWGLGYCSEYQLLKDVEALERWIAERGYPWVNQPPQIRIESPKPSPWDDDWRL